MKLDDLRSVTGAITSFVIIRDRSARVILFLSSVKKGLNGLLVSASFLCVPVFTLFRYTISTRTKVLIYF